MAYSNVMANFAKAMSGSEVSSYNFYLFFETRRLSIWVLEIYSRV